MTFIWKNFLHYRLTFRIFCYFTDYQSLSDDRPTGSEGGKCWYRTQRIQRLTDVCDAGQIRTYSQVQPSFTFNHSEIISWSYNKEVTALHALFTLPKLNTIPIRTPNQMATLKCWNFHIVQCQIQIPIPTKCYRNGITMGIGIAIRRC